MDSRCECCVQWKTAFHARLRPTKCKMDDRGAAQFDVATASAAEAIMIRVVLPHHLRTLARVGSEVELELNGQVTQRTILDALETWYPMLRGTIRDHDTHKRRP